MEGFRELHNNTVPKKHDSQNNTPLNITPLSNGLSYISDGLYIECPPPRTGFKIYHEVTLAKDPENKPKLHQLVLAFLNSPLLVTQWYHPPLRNTFARFKHIGWLS
jgi:hypothetical protein